jgi:hypothetical protein
MALAVNKPEDIDQALKPSLEETVAKSEADPERWDVDPWWPE